MQIRFSFKESVSGWSLENIKKWARNLFNLADIRFRARVGSTSKVDHVFGLIGVL